MAAQAPAGRARRAAPLDNAAIADLLVREAETAEGHLERALAKAARLAFMWPEEAAEIAASGRSLTVLPGIGPSLARRIHEWLEASGAREEPPEIRREFLTLAQARRVLAKHPDWLRELKGDLQMHTTWSDGSASVAEMAAAGIARGYEYLAITDHTKGLKIANGLDEQRLRAQGKEIASVNADLRAAGLVFTVLRSTEVNLSPAGEVDMEADALEELDLVLGSFHSALRREDGQTDRYVAALRNPSIQTLGHPKCRVYNRRVGLVADWRRVFAEAARLDKAVEIDGYADRQDLKLSLLKIAKQEGCRISLGTDAHHPEQLAFMELALAAACLARIPRERIINFLPVDHLKRWVAEVRGR
jgi:histidinol phosphatase-like PHP family hydrolase